MILYTYACEFCDRLFSHHRNNDYRPCESCGEMARRVWGFNTTISMPAHFNTSLGQYVTNTQTFNDSLKRAAEQKSLITGIEHTYQPIHPATLADPKAHGVTTSGLESQARARIGMPLT